MLDKEVKQEIIKVAYGDFYSKAKHFIDENGFVDMASFDLYPEDLKLSREKDIELKNEFWRPISLKGIEHNNGWTRIEPNGNNMPERGKMYRWFSQEHGKANFEYTGKADFFILRTYTHFKPLDEELNPIW